MRSLKIGGLLTQVSYRETYPFGVWKGNLLTQVVLRTGSTVIYEYLQLAEQFTIYEF